MITVKNAAFSYDGRNELFSDLSFSLAAGEVLTILGRNGIGKTTFLRCLLGILPWTRGECLVDGQRPDPAAVSDVIGYVPQSHAPAFPYTVFEMVMMGRARRIGLFRTPAAADRARVAELLDLVGVLPLADRAATELSGGQLQMVYIARALAVEPKLMILDEPEAHLDFHNQMIVLRLLKKLSTEQHMTIVMNTHSPENALKISDKSLFMRRGEHLFGPTESLLNEENLRRFYDIDCRVTETRVGDKVHRGLLTLL
ncbi:ABC transporter ATP-binding protein [Selenomonas sp. oral taxon 149]|uniref:ABC transporter ATP-binding protein n=1 Tax=Selenomonas sp. oral taxon 149 TaxID=712535 RepID=UPI0005871BA0|nr:ABC transporter ATP-binding protein [Selenomonas sp. oral taxon 149]